MVESRKNLSTKASPMQNFIFSANIVLPLFLIMISGYILKRTNIISEQFADSGNKLTFRFLLPSLIFYNVYNSDLKATFNARLMLFIVFAIIAINIIAFILVPIFIKDNKKRGVMIQAVARSNFLLIGIPICQAIYGVEGALEVSIVAAIFIPVVNVFAVLALSVFNDQGKADLKLILKNLITNPFIITLILAFIVNILGLRFPNVFDATLRNVSAIAPTFALLILGAEFDFSAIRSNGALIVAGTLGKLLLTPFIVLTAAYFLGFRNLEFCIILTAFASPIAVSSAIMAKNMHADHTLASHLVVSSTMFSSLSLFILIFIARSVSAM